jgi:hypothetical protein
MLEDSNIAIENQESSPDESENTTAFSSSGSRESRQQPTPVPSRCVMLSGLKPGTSLTYIARLLCRPLIPGDRSPYGCGEHISGSSPVPSRDGMCLIIECRDTRASAIVEAAWDNSELDGWRISAKQMLISDLEGIVIDPYHDPESLSSPWNNCPMNGSSDHTVLSRDRSWRKSYLPYIRPSASRRPATS